MAEHLGIKKCWFHNKKGKWHYDIPKKRITEIQSKCRVISSIELLTIIKDARVVKLVKAPDLGSGV